MDVPSSESVNKRQGQGSIPHSGRPLSNVVTFNSKLQNIFNFMNPKPQLQGTTVLKNFKLSKKLGTGAFGEIYLATNVNKGEEMYAAKLEDSTAKHPQLYFEAKLYKLLNADGLERGIPRVYAMTTEGSYNIMLMDLLGQSLEDIFTELNRKLSLKTVLIIADQLLERIEFLHNKEFLHRDIKPDNFLVGKGKNADKIYMIDLGLAKRYMRDGNHIPYKEGKDLTGTARYASVNTHIGIEQSRRDDIESIGYVLMYFLRGILPWQNMKSKDTKTKYAMIKDKKMSTPSEVLCKGFPNQFVAYLNYAKGLKFFEKPDYAYLRKLFEDLRKKSGFEMDGVFDWSSQPKVGYISSVGPCDPKKVQEKYIKMKEQTLPNTGSKQAKKPQGMSIEKSNTSNKLNANFSKALTKTKTGSEKVTPVEVQKVLPPKVSVIKR